jgi:hypothetical protein
MTTRLVEVRQAILKQNDVAARALRERFLAAKAAGGQPRLESGRGENGLLGSGLAPPA